ncbi:MAG: DUF151 domain-containing protein [bacterium]|nr:DUF151 domain-containing protein [bacterium]
MDVAGISLFPPFQGYGIILKERKPEGRWFPIFIGPAEAQTISTLLRGQKYERPMTYDMFQSIIVAASVSVLKVSIIELKNNTFFAEIDLQCGDDVKTIDARPSDAIALALKTGAPIYVAKKILDETGFTGEIGEPPEKPSNLLTDEDETDVTRLQVKLEELVTQERYEEAAVLRDRIRELTKQEQTEQG